MNDISYSSPKTLDEAVSAMVAAKGAGRILAGGTDLLVQMRAGFVKPGSIIVDIKKIAEMMSHRGQGRRLLQIGAAVSGMALHEHATLGKAWPGVVEAVNLIGSTQIQGRASIGGNLCNASPAADSVPALIAAGAIVTVQGPKGRREVPVEKIPAGPGRTTLDARRDRRQLHPAGAAGAVRPTPTCASSRAPRWTSPWSASASASRSMQGGTCTAARVALGAVAPTRAAGRGRGRGADRHQAR